MNSPRVAVDALGGDHGLAVAVRGAVDAARAYGLRVLLVGPEDAVRREVAAAGGSGLPLEVRHAPEEVGMAEKVTRATLKKRSSILVALETVRAGEADAFFSAGNTAACWTIARLVLGTLEEVDRPALAAVMPSRCGQTVILDVGANASCKARNLEEFALMGDVYARAMFGVERPRVGVMSVGEEETKGNELVREVHEVLKGSALNFCGNAEGRDVFNGRFDVIVMDGFVGNIVLKASESLAAQLMELVKGELMRTPIRKAGALLARGAFRDVKKRIDPAEYGGAPLLGVRGACVIGHGSSSAYAIHHGVRVAAHFHSSGVNAQIERGLRALGARKTPAATAESA